LTFKMKELEAVGGDLAKKEYKPKFKYYQK
jgi:hypothetical protein